jgi:hypothetical protein
MSTAVADVSGLLEAAASPEVTPTPTETTVEETPVETPEGETTETPEGGEGTGKVAAEGEKPVDARTNPDAIRKALKAMRDSSPENAPIARKLNDIVGREGAYRAVFPKVADAKQAKFLLESIGGGEGLTNLQNTIKSVNETDQLLYTGDGKVVKNLYEDMKAAGHPEALGKLASPFLDHLKEVDEKAYFSALRPHFFQGIVDSGLPDVLDGLEAALSNQVDGKPSPNLEAVKGLVSEMRKWFSGLDKSIKTTKDPELDQRRQAFEKEQSEFRSQQTKAFQGDVNAEWNRVNNQVLGAALKPYLALPFAKNWTDATKKSVAREITSTLTQELSADKAYQAQMDALWSEAKPDKSKIINFHKSKLDIIGKRIVKDVLDARYPGFSTVKGAAPAKPAAKPAAQAQATGKPIYQTSKPKWEDVDFERDPNKLLYITGRFFDKRGVLRTWNQKYK